MSGRFRRAYAAFVSADWYSMASPKDNKGGARRAYRLMGAGFEFAGVVAVFVLLGWWLDRKFDTSPWLLLTGLGMAFFGGTYKLWRIGQADFDDGQKSDHSTKHR